MTTFWDIFARVGSGIFLAIVLFLTIRILVLGVSRGQTSIIGHKRLNKFFQKFLEYVGNVNPQEEPTKRD